MSKLISFLVVLQKKILQEFCRVQTKGEAANASLWSFSFTILRLTLPVMAITWSKPGSHTIRRRPLLI